MIADKLPRALTEPFVTAHRLKNVANELWVLRFPLALLGTQIGRTVTVLRLRTGQLILHSTAPFSAADVTAIRALGQPAWIVDATLFHDTFARDGRAAFPDIAYFAPEGFRPSFGTTNAASLEPGLLSSPPPEWAGQVDVLQLDGMPKVREHVFLHRATRTLIVADLVFNFGPRSSAWTRWFFRWPGGIRQFPGMSRLFRASIRDRAAFARSIETMLQWDFDRLIVGHGEIIESGAKAKLAAALGRQGF
jgi:hypothetical protein